MYKKSHNKRKQKRVLFYKILNSKLEAKWLELKIEIKKHRKALS